MIHYEDGKFEAKGTMAKIMSELTMAIHAVRIAMEQEGYDGKDIETYLFEAYKFGSMSEEELEHFIKDRNPEEVIQWDKILN